MKYDLIPVGTMAHEFVCAIGGMYGPQMANHIAMNSWRNTFRGALGTYLYDSFGWDIFSLNFSEDFANLFKRSSRGQWRQPCGTAKDCGEIPFVRHRPPHEASHIQQCARHGPCDRNTTLRPGVLPTFFRDRHALHKRLRGREAHEHRHQTGGRENHRVMDFLQRYLQAERRRRQAYRQARK